jgi:hypothetical protein
MPDCEDDFGPVFSNVIFHGYSVRRVLGTHRADYAEKMGRSENQGPIELDISGWQAILSIRFFM